MYAASTSSGIRKRSPGYSASFDEEEAVRAVEVADRPRRLGEDVERRGRGGRSDPPAVRATTAGRLPVRSVTGVSTGRATPTMPHPSATDEGETMGQLDGRVAIITGGARGQGAAEGRLFARRGRDRLPHRRARRGGRRDRGRDRGDVRRARRHRRRPVEGRRRAGARRRRARRHPRQQRRNPALGDDDRDLDRRVEPGRGDQPDRRVPRDAGGRPDDEGPGVRAASSTSRRSPRTAAVRRASPTARRSGPFGG